MPNLASSGSRIAPITEFRGSYRWLSNFYPCSVTLDKVPYPSVENAYQAAKTLDLHFRVDFKLCSAAEAKRLGRVAVLRPDWDQVKIEIMEALLRQKFALGTEFARLLLSTGDAELIEGNWWGDTFWGQCPLGKGENWLGRLLMKIRGELA